MEAGLPEVVAMLNNGSAKPLWNLTDSITELIPEVSVQTDE